MSTLGEERIYTEQELERIKQHPVPKHIAIIPDGNRRWAKARHVDAVQGHWEGADILLDIVKGARDLGVEAVTIYTFSTENWNRSIEEVEGIFEVVKTYLVEQRQPMVDEGVRLSAIGDLSMMPQEMLDVLDQTREATKECTEIDFILALNYGGKDSMIRAINQLLDQGVKRLDENMLRQALETARWPDPDLMIRTSGEMRTSNFLLWEASYAEFYTTDALWPAFTPHHLLKAVEAFQQRDRRWGGA